MSDPRYPIGQFQRPESITPTHLEEWIWQIAEGPAQMRQAVAGLTEQQLDAPYREGGWKVRQVVHHLADAHMNHFIRFKFAVTEESPPIRPFQEADWAETADAAGPVEPSLAVLEGVTARWVRLLGSLDGAGFARTIHHTTSGVLRLDLMTGLAAWHTRHHIAQITSLRERMGW